MTLDEFSPLSTGNLQIAPNARTDVCDALDFPQISLLLLSTNNLKLIDDYDGK